MKAQRAVKVLNLASILIVAISAIALAVRYELIRIPQAIAHLVSGGLQETSDARLDPVVEGAVLKFVLATDCQYCEQSYEFYRALLASRSAKEFKAVAVFPDPSNLTREFLQSRGLSFDDVERASYAELGVSGTPTLLLMDAAGRTIWQWEGFQPEESQLRIAHALGVDRIFPAASYGENVRTRYLGGVEKVPTLGLDTFKELIDGDAITVIDARSSKRYSEWHVAKSINVPMETLDSKSIARISRQKPVAIICDYSDPMVCEKDRDSDIENSACFLAGALFVREGFKDVSVVSVTTTQLRSALDVVPAVRSADAAAQLTSNHTQ